MAQVIKLKRSAVAGKTPQTSSLELGELGINTSDGKIYFHRSSSSDDSIQSVLTTDATITGSLKLSGSQHLSGSLNVMDDLTYGGNLTASLGSTSSFDRITSVGTSSIGFLIASGSNFATFTDQTGSFASGSDVQQILDESGSYLVDTDTGSLGKVTLVSDITGSITSTASFGKIFGDGSDLDNVADPAAISGSFQGGGSNLISGSIISTGSFGKIFGDGSSLSNVADPDAISGSFQGGGSNTISGSLISTASFGTLELANSHGFVRSTETGSFASGSDLHQILAESSSYVLESETGSFASGSDVQTISDTYASGSDVQTISDTYASGSDLHQILAESSSYVLEQETGSFASGSDLQVILAESASYLNNDTTSSFGAVSMDSTLFVQGDITTSGSVVAQQFRTEFVSESIIFASGSTQFGDSSDDKHRYTGSIEITGNISSSFTSTGSFGNLKLADFGGLPFASGSDVQGILDTYASGSDLQVILAESSSYVVESETGSFASGSDVQGILDDYAKGTEISGSFNQGFEFTGTISGSITSTASFGKIFGDGSDLENVADPTAISGSFQGGGSNSFSGSLISTASFGTLELVNSHGFVLSTETGSFASGSDLQVILAESASYVVSTNTGSFASGSDVSQIQALTSSFLQNSDTASLQSTIITSSLEITGSQTFEGTDNFINFKSEYSGSKITKWEMGKNSDDDFKINRYGGSGSFLDQPISIASSSGITIIKDQLTKSSGVTRLIAGGSTTDGVSVYNDKKVGIGTGTTAIGDEKFLVAGDTGITGSLFVSSSITTPELINNTGTLKVSQSVSDGDIEISVNDGGTTKKAITIDGSDAGSVILGNNLRMGDNQKIRLGTSNDFNLYHDGSNSYLYNETTGGKIIIQNNAFDSDIEIKVSDSGSLVNAIIIDASEAGDVLLPNDNQSLKVGAGGDLRLIHNGSNSFLENSTSNGGHLYISNRAQDKSIFLRVDDSGTEFNAVTIDGAQGGKAIFVGGVSSSLGQTGSFDRLEANTLNASISPFASGSDVSQIQAQTGSYATGSDLHQFLAESASYLVDADTGSLGLVTLGNDITGSITSTASFGVTYVEDKIGVGTTTPSDTLQVEGSIGVGVGRDAQLTSVNNGLAIRNFVSNADMFFYVNDGGSDTEAMRIDGATTNVGIGSTAPNDDKLLVAGNAGITGDLNVSGSITANEYIVNSSVTNVTQSFSSGSTIFGDSLDDTHKFTGSLGVTGSIAVGKPDASYNLDVNRSTAGVIAQFQFGDDTDGRIQIYADANAGSVGNDTGLSGETIYFQDDLGLRFITNSSEKMRLTTGGVLSIGATSFGTADNLKLLVAGDTGITGSLNVSGSITANHQPNVHSLSGSLHVSGGIGGTLHLSSSTSTPMIQFHQSSSDAAILLQTDEYGADLWKVIEFSEYNHSGLLIGQTFNTATGDTIRVRAGGNGDCDVEHHLGDSSFMVTDLGDVTTAHAKIDSSGLTTSGSVTASNGATIGNTETGSFTLSELNVIGTGIGLSLGSTSGIAGLRLRDNRASNNGVVAQRSDGRLSIASTENSYGVTGIEILPTGRIAVGNTGFGRDDSSLIEHMKIHGSVGITGSLTVSGSITTNPLQTNSSASVAYLELTGSSGDLSRVQLSNGGGVYSKLATNERSSVRLIQYTTGNQVFIGGNQELTLSGGTIVNELGNAVDFRVETNANTHAIFLDDSADALGIFTSTPTSELTVEGDVSASGNFITTSTGSFGNVKVAGNLQLFDSSDNTTQRLQFGNARDLTMYHDGSNSYLVHGGTGNFIIQTGTDDGDIILKSDDGSGGVTAYLTLDGSGGYMVANRFLIFTDGQKAEFGNSEDLKIYHDGSNSYIEQGGTGDLIIRNNIDDKDVILQSDDGSGGVTAYLTLDGSITKTTFSQDARVVDSKKIGFGNADDLQIYHDGTNSVINNTTGDLQIYNNLDDKDIVFLTDNGSGGTTAYLTLDGSTTDLSLTPPGITHLLEANTGTPASTYAAPLSASLVIEDNATPTKNSIVIKTHAVGEDNVIGALKFVSSPDGANYNWNGIEAIAGTSGMAQDLVFYTSDSNTGGVTSTERLRITQNLITASIASTASFGKIIADEFSGATFSNVSGGLGSTGSYSRLDAHSDGIGSATLLHLDNYVGSDLSQHQSYIDFSLRDSNDNHTPQVRIGAEVGQNGDANSQQKEGSGAFIVFTTNASGISTNLTELTEKFRVDYLGDVHIKSGSMNISGSILPTTDNQVDIGSSSKRFNDVFAVQTTVGAVFETGLRSKGIGKEETGTIVVWRNGKLVPCDTSEDTMVMGVVKQGKDEPIVMGAEPVLVTGDVKEGDFITTSTKLGHGKKLENGYLLKKEMFGKVIAQALEDSTGESSLIKCMIRKM